MSFSAIVDIDGVHNPKTGGFHVVQDALDAKHNHIFVKKGTYPGFNNTRNGVTICGESMNDTLFDGTPKGEHAVTNTGAWCHFSNFKMRTAAGGVGAHKDGVNDTGSANLYERILMTECDNVAFHFVSGGAGVSVVRDCVAYSAIDSYKIYLEQPSCHIFGGYIANAGSYGLEIGALGDNAIVQGVMFAANTTYSIRIHADAENCIVDGVRATGASISDGSGTSVIGDNDTT